MPMPTHRPVSAWRRSRPVLESLETRCLPSGSPWFFKALSPILQHLQNHDHHGHHPGALARGVEPLSLILSSSDHDHDGPGGHAHSHDDGDNDDNDGGDDDDEHDHGHNDGHDDDNEHGQQESPPPVGDDTPPPDDVPVPAPVQAPEGSAADDNAAPDVPVPVIPTPPAANATADQPHGPGPDSAEAVVVATSPERTAPAAQALAAAPGAAADPGAEPAAAPVVGLADPSIPRPTDTTDQPADEAAPPSLRADLASGGLKSAALFAPPTGSGPEAESDAAAGANVSAAIAAVPQSLAEAVAAVRAVVPAAVFSGAAALAPREGDLLSHFAPFDRAALDRAFEQFAGHLDVLGQGLGTSLGAAEWAAWGMALGIAAVGCDAGRRRLRRPRRAAVTADGDTTWTGSWPGSFATDAV